MAASYWKWVFLVPAWFVAFAMVSGIRDMASDQFMLQAVIAEQGSVYFYNGYLSAALLTLLPIVAVTGKALVKRQELNKAKQAGTR